MIDTFSADSNTSFNLVEDNVKSFNLIVNTTLIEMSSLLDRFQQQTTDMRSIIGTLNNTNMHVEQTMEERRESMDSIANLLIAKTETIDTVMREYSDKLAQSVENAESKAETLSDTIKTVALNATSNITNEIEKLRETAQQESQIAGEKMKSSQESLLVEIRKSVSDAATNFEESIDKMQESARIMLNELNSTRNELRNGLIGLPDVARDSTHALRQVILEQINALNELSNIVSSQTGTLDVSSPISNKSAPVVTSGKLDTQPDSASKIQGNDNSEQGWMSNLLRRTTAKSNQVNQKSTKGKSNDIEISSLANKMSGAVDDKIYKQTWEKYLQGERNIFTLDIYTSEGKKLFDEIKTKFTSDKKFKATVEDFLTDFTNLLKKQADKDIHKTQGYLFSDTGKVFTILAHACGRLVGAESAF